MASELSFLFALKCAGLKYADDEKDDGYVHLVFNNKPLKFYDRNEVLYWGEKTVDNSEEFEAYYAGEKEGAAYWIMQLNPEKCAKNGILPFMSYDFVVSQGNTIRPDNYDNVYFDVTVDRDDLKMSDIAFLDKLFCIFNTDFPEDYRGHSMSVSDVIVLYRGGRKTAYYVDSIGFRDVSDVFLKRD